MKSSQRQTIHKEDRYTTGLLLVNLGSPDNPDGKSIKRYLKQFLQDRRVIEVPTVIWFFILRLIILPLRSNKVAKLYASVWTAKGAPLVAGTQELSEQLKKHYENNAKHRNIDVSWAMRYGSPSISQTLKRWQQHGIERMIVLPLYPQYAASTCATVFDQIAKDLSTARWLPHMHFINGYHDHKLYIKAIADSIQATERTNNKNSLLLLSFHGLPRSMLEKGDPYYCFCHASARLIAEELKLNDEQWQLCFQSRFGKQPWLQPYTDTTLQQLPKKGIKKVRVVCPGFSIDCLETLEEIAIQNKELFIKSGGEEFEYIPCLNQTSKQQELLQSLIDPILEAWEKTDKKRQQITGDQRSQLYKQEAAQLNNQPH